MATRETAPSLTNHSAHSRNTTETDSLEQAKEPRGPTAGAAMFLSNRDSPPKQTCTRRHTGGSTHAESVDCQPKETIVNQRRQLSCEEVRSPKPNPRKRTAQVNKHPHQVPLDRSLCGALPMWFTVCATSSQYVPQVRVTFQVSWSWSCHDGLRRARPVAGVSSRSSSSSLCFRSHEVPTPLPRGPSIPDPRAGWGRDALG